MKLLKNLIFEEDFILSPKSDNFVVLLNYPDKVLIKYGDIFAEEYE